MKNKRERLYDDVMTLLGRVPCFRCSGAVSRSEASLEHIIPRNLGGTSARANLAISHRWCNNSRKDQRPSIQEEADVLMGRAWPRQVEQQSNEQSTTVKEVK